MNAAAPVQELMRNFAYRFASSNASAEVLLDSNALKDMHAGLAEKSQTRWASVSRDKIFILCLKLLALHK